jgi:DeoR family fructose operon transcriptional repressor
MIRTARRAVAVADSSKYGNDYLTVFSDFGDLALLITDTGLSEDDGARIVRAGRGLDVVRV